jgi:hypothetical protein
MSQQNKELGKTEIVDGEHSAGENGAGGNLPDPNNPVLQPPKDPEPKKKTWKRKLISWSVILLLIGAGLGALYLLMRVQRVSVTVNADSGRNTQRTKPQNEVANSDSHLTGEAIDMVRSAAGVDANTQPRNSASPVPSPTASPGTTQNGKVDFTGNSPVFGDVGKNGDTDSNLQTKEGSAQSKTNRSSVVEPQSHANPTQSLFVDEAVSKPAPAPVPPSQTSREARPAAPLTIKQAPPTVPPFGTMLPVRTQGVIFTLRNNSYARLELTRDMSGSGWSLPKGTVLIGRTTGSEHDRAFVNVVGYIDPRENKLVPMTGDVLGSDGANGIPGKRVNVDRTSVKQTLRKVASGGLQVATSMAGAFTGRGTILIDSAGYRLLDPINDQARGLVNGSDKNTFVKVEAGQQAYVMVVDLPGRVEGADAPGTEQPPRFSGISENSLTDREVMELILLGTADEVRAAMPLMTEEQKRLAIKMQENDRP